MIFGYPLVKRIERRVKDMFEASKMINHPIYEMALALSITFIIPLIGAIAGLVLTNIAAFNEVVRKMKRNYMKKTHPIEARRAKY